MDITVKKLSKSYGDSPVLRDFSAVFSGGKVTALLGKSGVGKTTLLNCIASLTGYVGEICGVNGLSYVFQEDRLVPNLTVYGNLALTSGRGKRAEIKRILGFIGLTDKAHRLPEELSGGERKRVALARAFLSESDLMLLDEPTNSLDVGLKRRAWNYFNALMSEYSRTALYVTHDVDEALSVADEVCVINDCGIVYRKAIASDKPTRSFSSPDLVSVRESIYGYLGG